MLPAPQFYFAPSDIANKKTSFNPFPGKAEERRSNFENLKLFIYEDAHYITSSFRKNVLKVALP
jgi:hypothetical protein